MNRPLAEPAMDTPVPAPWPPMPTARRYRPRADPVDLRERLVFWLCVAMVLVFSQAWQLPLIGDPPRAGAALLQQVGFLPAYAVAALIFVITPRRVFLATIRQPFLIALMAVVMASVFWSIDPSTTLRRSIAVAFTTLAGLALAGRFTWAQMAEVIAAAFAVLVVASFVAGIAFPSLGVMRDLFPGAWRGLWAEKNILGGVMAQGFCIFAATAMLNPRRFWLWAIFAALAIALVLLSQSKTSLVSVAIGMAALGFIFIVQRGPALGVAALWAAVAGAILLTAFVIFASDVFFQLLGKDATFTGRTKIWAAMMRQIEQRPWTGFGYAAVWGDESGRGPFAWIEKEAGFTPQHAHNSWLEQWLGLGFWGLGAFGLFYLQTIALAVVSVFRHKGAFLAFPFLLVYTLMTMTESIALVYNDFRWTLFVAFAVKLAFPDRELER